MTDFEAVAVGGMLVEYNVRDTVRGQALAFTVSGAVDYPLKMFGVYFVSPGVPVAPIACGGIGDPWPPAPIPACLPALVVSDRDGLFGRACSRCKGYWRSTSPPSEAEGYCPYCGDNPGFEMTRGQLHYLQACSTIIAQLVAAGGEATGRIDLNMPMTEDDVAWRIIAEERQQLHYRCERCDTPQDILGLVGYCCSCGQRNDLTCLKTSLERIQGELRQGRQSEGAIRDTVSAFDGFVSGLAKQLLARIPLHPRRRNVWTQAFHKLGPVLKNFEEHFGFSLRRRLGNEEDFMALMFERRHLYEHRQGIVDQRYLDESGDATGLRVGQRIEDTQDNAFRLISAVSRLADAILAEFHQVFPVRQLTAFETDHRQRAN